MAPSGGMDSCLSVLGASPQTTGLPSLKLSQNIEWVERETIRRALER